MTEGQAVETPAKGSRFGNFLSEAFLAYILGSYVFCTLLLLLNVYVVYFVSGNGEFTFLGMSSGLRALGIAAAFLVCAPLSAILVLMFFAYLWRFYDQPLMGIFVLAAFAVSVLAGWLARKSCRRSPRVSGAPREKRKEAAESRAEQ